MKIVKYQDLEWGILKLWDVQTAVAPIIIGALSTVTDHATAYLTVSGVTLIFKTFQKLTLLEAEQFLKKMLETKG